MDNILSSASQLEYLSKISDEFESQIFGLPQNQDEKKTEEKSIEIKKKNHQIQRKKNILTVITPEEVKSILRSVGAPYQFDNFAKMSFDNRD